MSILFKARGTPSIGIFFMRLVVGSYTLILGIMQASNVQVYISKVKGLGILGENLSFIIGFVLPFILILFGSLYIMGFFTPFTSLTLALISLLKIAARGLFPTDGIPFNKDMLFLVCFLITLFGGAGVFSFDVLLDRKKKKAKDDTNQKTTVVTAEIISDKPGETSSENKEQPG